MSWALSEGAVSWLFSLLVCSQTVTPPTPIPTPSWPSFRGPNGLGKAAHANAPLTWNGKSGENILWKVPILKAGTSSPVVWGNRVFVTGSDDASRDIYAFDADTGKAAWTAATVLASGTLPKILEGTTYAAPTLATDGLRVYAVFATGDVVAYALDGTKAWARRLDAFKISYGHASSLLTHGGRVLLQHDHQGGGHLLALDSESGRTLWDQARDVKESWASPILVNSGSRWELILNAKPSVMGHDPATGAILWKVGGMDGEVAVSPAYSGGVVYAVTDNGGMVAIRLGAEPKLLWKYEENLPDVSSPVATEQHVILASSGGVVTCLAAATGKKLWENTFEEGFYSSPVIVGDRVYLVDREGLTIVFRLGDTYQELARNVLGEKVSCTPAFPEGRIYLRTEKNLYCIGKGLR